DHVGTAAVAFRDLSGSLARLPLAAVLALSDIQGKYRRTILGPLWIAIGQAATVGGFVLVFSGLFNTPPATYAVYLAAGIPVWALFSQFLSDMPNTFIAARGVIESYELPWLTHIWRRSIGYVLTFLHHIVTLFAVMAILAANGQLSEPPTWNMLLAVPALAILLVAGTGAGMLLAVLGARYRDLQPAMQVVASFLFLFTPVMWHADRLGPGLAWTYQFNPLYYYVALVRDPLLGEAPAPELWLGAAGGAALIFAVGFLAFLLGRRRLYHWL
ncbi:MAG: ABC transporter permease, partial [Vitreimonas sp.]